MQARVERVASPGDADSPAGNAWVVCDDDEVIVIDPGRDGAAVLDATAGRQILAIICTHGHAAHVAAAVVVAERDGSPVALHRRDVLLWRESHAGTEPEIEMEDGGIFEVADVTLEVIHAPGHSPGSVCLYSEELETVFSGDCLLASGPAPYEGAYPDFPAQLSAIGEHLLTLPGETRVRPGHGEESTIGAAQKRFDGWVSAGPQPVSADFPD
jgi:glyoxylase-like metal-dependent hydrolase (beta-lactamase superfamily II)